MMTSEHGKILDRNLLIEIKRFEKSKQSFEEVEGQYHGLLIALGAVLITGFLWPTKNELLPAFVWLIAAIPCFWQPTKKYLVSRIVWSVGKYYETQLSHAGVAYFSNDSDAFLLEAEPTNRACERYHDPDLPVCWDGNIALFNLDCFRVLDEAYDQSATTNKVYLPVTSLTDFFWGQIEMEDAIRLIFSSDSGVDDIVKRNGIRFRQINI